MPAQVPSGSGDCTRRVRQDFLEHRPHELAELGQVGEAALTSDQQPPELLFEFLDRARERGLRHVALLRGAREVQRLAKGKKISDLIQFHLAPSAQPQTVDPKCASQNSTACCADHPPRLVSISSIWEYISVYLHITSVIGKPVNSDSMVTLRLWHRRGRAT